MPNRPVPDPVQTDFRGPREAHQRGDWGAATAVIEHGSGLDGDDELAVELP